jgi:hypothetical protein
MSDFIAERLWPEARVERSIFGTDDPRAIWAQVLHACPDAVDCFAFEVGIGARFGLVREGGTRVALKIHTPDTNLDYLDAVQRVQAHLAANGFPCPRPLGVRGRATLEEWIDTGAYRDAHEPAVRSVLAERLAELILLTQPLHPLPGMEPYLPSNPTPLWPKPHNVLFDFEATSAGAEWIDEIAGAAKPLCDARVGALVIGHGDWTATHFRFDGLRPTVVYDWDSLNTDFEAVFVGGAAATFTYTERLPVDVWPSVTEAEAFLEEYEHARGTPFTPAEAAAARAAAVYTRAYSTRCTHAVGKDTAGLCLRGYVDAFLD